MDQMDGTLTIPKIDFPKMRRLVGVPPGQDILGHVAYAPPTVANEAGWRLWLTVDGRGPLLPLLHRSLEPHAQREALALIEEVEREGMLAMELQPGYHDLMQVRARPPRAVLELALTKRPQTRRPRGLACRSIWRSARCRARC